MEGMPKLCFTMPCGFRLFMQPLAFLFFLCLGLSTMRAGFGSLKRAEGVADNQVSGTVSPRRVKKFDLAPSKPCALQVHALPPTGPGIMTTPAMLSGLLQRSARSLPSRFYSV
jgi:hypothetical protein